MINITLYFCKYSIVVLDEVDQLSDKVLYSMFELKIVLIGIANTLKMTTACEFIIQSCVTKLLFLFLLWRWKQDLVSDLVLVPNELYMGNNLHKEK